MVNLAAGKELKELWTSGIYFHFYSSSFTHSWHIKRGYFVQIGIRPWRQKFQKLWVLVEHDRAVLRYNVPLIYSPLYPSLAFHSFLTASFSSQVSRSACPSWMQSKVKHSLWKFRKLRVLSQSLALSGLYTAIVFGFKVLYEDIYVCQRIPSKRKYY